MPAGGCIVLCISIYVVMVTDSEQTDCQQLFNNFDVLTDYPGTDPKNRHFMDA